jgi:DNA-binding MarR family transcriptional regulator
LHIDRLGCICNFVPADSHRHAAEIARDCMASRVRRLERLLTRIYDDALRGQGLTGSQLGMLVAIQLSGKTTAAAVGQRLDLEKSTVSRNLARLAAAGLVDPSDGLRITARGSAAIAACHPAWRQAQTKARRALHPAETRLIGRLAPPSTKSHRKREGRAP